MQRPIGEVFDCTLENGEIVSLQVIESNKGSCSKCIFYNDIKNCNFTDSQTGLCVDRNFIKVKNHKLPEIDKEKQQKAKKLLLDLAQESDTFNSQREIWRYLSESEENKVIDNEGGIAGFKNGELIEFNDGKSTKLSFIKFKDWKKYTTPKTIIVNGVEIEAPLKSLEGVDVVYVPDFVSENKYCKCEVGTIFAKIPFKNNMAFATPEAAIACHDAIKKGIIIPQ